MPGTQSRWTGGGFSSCATHAKVSEGGQVCWGLEVRAVGAQQVHEFGVHPGERMPDVNSEGGQLGAGLWRGDGLGKGGEA